MSNAPEYLTGMPGVRPKPLHPFDTAVTELLSALSKALMNAPEARRYPDITSLAFFIRRANLERMKEAYAGELRLGRGIVFHIAPGNVPVNFAYSLVTALLSGCASVVKAPSKPFEQTEIICRELNGLLDGEHSAIKPYISIVRYPREDEVQTRAFSAECDARVIWGGDETVRRVREAPLPPRAVEVTFPDRYSLLCADAAHILEMDDSELAKAALGFYNDTYLTDQNACTSPRLVYWLGAEGEVNKAKKRFWKAVRDYAAPRYAVQPVIAVDKLTEACRAGIELEDACIEKECDSLITRVSVSRLDERTDGFRCAGGFFIEYVGETLDALKPIVKPKYQTLSYIGLDPSALKAFVVNNGLCGIDRIAPVGHTMDFALVWDGVDLIRTLSRRITAI